MTKKTRLSGFSGNKRLFQTQKFEVTESFVLHFYGFIYKKKKKQCVIIGSYNWFRTFSSFKFFLKFGQPFSNSSHSGPLEATLARSIEKFLYQNDGDSRGTKKDNHNYGVSSTNVAVEKHEARNVIARCFI